MLIKEVRKMAERERLKITVELTGIDEAIKQTKRTVVRIYNNA